MTDIERRKALRTCIVRLVETANELKGESVNDPEEVMQRLEQVKNTEKLANEWGALKHDVVRLYEQSLYDDLIAECKMYDEHCDSVILQGTHQGVLH